VATFDRGLSLREMRWRDRAVRTNPPDETTRARVVAKRRKRVLAIASEHASEPAEQRALFAAAATGLRRGGVDAAREPAEGQRLEPDPARPAQRRVEQT